MVQPSGSRCTLTQSATTISENSFLAERQSLHESLVADNTPGTVKSNPKCLTRVQARLPDIGSYGLRR
jgi:hypothetical protein